MERIFASEEPIDAGTHRILVCSDRYAAPVAERILPDGAVHLIFNLGDRQYGERGAEHPSLVTGATCRPTRIQLTGALEQVCVRLRVGAAAAVLGVPAGEVTERGVSLDDLWGAAAEEVRERMHATPAAALHDDELDEESSPGAASAHPRSPRTALLAALLDERIARAEPPPPVTFEAVRRIVASSGQLRVGALAAELGLSERRLQQLFHLHVGLSPKALGRLARFRAVLALRRPRPSRPRSSTRSNRASRTSGPSWIERAIAVGYYDQAHLTHELKELTGMTPGQLARADFGFFQDPFLAAG